MRAKLIGSTKHLFFALFYATSGVVITALVAIVWLLNARPELSVWHKLDLQHQYQGQKQIRSFNDYLALEDKLFDELQSEIYQRYQPSVSSPINRYETGSLSDPNQWQNNWNRSFEWPKKDAEYGVLLLHGMSDSPYAMRHLAQSFDDNAAVLGLRLPGHGTIPSALTRLRWKDMAKAVKLATEHMQQRLQGRPLYVIGFSTGAALALNHELEQIHQGHAPAYDKMVFISPAIGLPTIAAGAYWQAKLGEVLGLEKLAWNSIKVEYDPFKYLSFAVNAGDVVYSLTNRNEYLMAQFNDEQLGQIPSILTFQSVVDDTVSTPAVLSRLFYYLPSLQHELVLFDVNRSRLKNSLMKTEPLAQLASLGMDTDKRFHVSLIENMSQSSNQVQSRTVIDQGAETIISPLALEWPSDVYSLSHVALPFPEYDPLYGPHEDPDYQGVHIGQAIFQGERGIFNVEASDMLRQKWNPFYPYMESRIHNFITAK
ncbi:alpha/beta hydrolase [Shewanella maritima]|uniref:alpha/beta hydrolase n=1 Tax=Shewanella maritima TaxID=2520507 RepID=UPI0037368297